MSPEQELKPRPITSREAVADAMMVAQANYLLPNANIADEKSFELSIWVESIGQCEAGSLTVAKYLAGKHRSLFNGIVLLHADKDTEALANGWGNHYRFLARDNDGKWFTGSPANHDVGAGSRSRLVTVSSNNSLELLMVWVKRLDMGKWPSARFIKEVFNTDKDVIPIGEDGIVKDPLLIKLWKPRGNYKPREIVTRYIPHSNPVRTP